MGKFLFDTFTNEPAGRNLTNHLPDFGYRDALGRPGQWKVFDGGHDWVMEGGNALHSGSGFGLYYNDSEPPGAEYWVEATMALDVHSGSLKDLVVAGRVDPSTAGGTSQTYYRGVKRRRDVTVSELILERVQSGAVVLLASKLITDSADGAEDVLRLEIRDATKKLFWNGTEELSSTDNAITAKGRAGIGAAPEGARVTCFCVRASSDFGPEGLEVEELVSTGGPHDSVEDAAGFLTGWERRRRITVRRGRASGTQTDFPALIDLSALLNIFTSALPDGGDIAVTGADGTTELKRELVAIDPAASTGELYFKAPVMEDYATFYVYYNNPQATKLNDADTWNADYLLVSHMQEDPSGGAGTIKDSTAAGSHGTATGTASTEGMSGGSALDFDGVDDNVDFGDVEPTAAFSVSAWIRPGFADFDGATQMLVDKTSQNTSGLRLAFDSTIDSFRLRAETGSGGFVNADLNGFGFEPGETHFLKGTWDGVNLRIHWDGQLSGTEPLAGTLTGNDDGLLVGLETLSGLFPWKGAVDEVRLSKVKDSEDWGATEYANYAAPGDFWHQAELESLDFPVDDTFLGALVSAVSGSGTVPPARELSGHTPLTSGLRWRRRGITGVDGLFVDNLVFTGSATRTIGSSSTVTRYLHSPSAGAAGSIALYTADPAPASAEYDVSATVEAPDPGGGSPFFLVARYQPGGDYYSAGSYGSGTGAELRIYKTVGGTPTLLASTPAPITVGDVLTFEVRGSAKRLLVNGAVAISTTDDTITGAGRAGLGIGAAWASGDSVSASWEVSAFKVTLFVPAILPTGAASAEAWGGAGLGPGVAMLAAGALTQGEGWGGALMVHNIELVSVPPAEAWGMAGLVTFILAPQGIAAAGAWGAADVLNRRFLVQPSSVDSGEQFGLGYVEGVRVYPFGFSGTEAWGTPRATSLSFQFRWSLRDAEGDAALYERRILEPPVLRETRTNPLFGISGFGETTLALDNTDGALNTVPLVGAFVKIWAGLDEGSGVDGPLKTLYVEAASDAMPTGEPVAGTSVEFEGIITALKLGWRTEVRIEDRSQRIFEEIVPARLVSAESVGAGPFASAQAAGARIPVVAGRARKLPLLPVKADPALREWDYLVCEAGGLGGEGIGGVLTVYREEQALRDIEGAVGGGSGASQLVLEAADRRPFDDWYKWFWVDILDAGGSVLNTAPLHVTAYDQGANSVTLSAPHGVTNVSQQRYVLREWRLLTDGTYPGLAALRLKKPLAVGAQTAALFADVDGLGVEQNPVRLVQSILTNMVWGLGLPVDAASFDAAAADPAVAALKTEGALTRGTRAFEVLDALLSMRGMTLVPGSALGIRVDGVKVPTAAFGAGDGIMENIIEVGGLSSTGLGELTRSLVGRYRPDYKDRTLTETLERAVHTLGSAREEPLDLVYEHGTADRVLHFLAGRLKSFNEVLDITVGMEGAGVKKGDAVSVSVPSLGIGGAWEVIESRRRFARTELTLMRYGPGTYAYTATPGLPADTPGIAPDLSLTTPDPVSGLSAQPGSTQGGGFIDLSWTLPEDIAERARVYWRLSAASSAEWTDAGTGVVDFTIGGLAFGDDVDVQVVAESPSGLLSAAVQALMLMVPGDPTDTVSPATPGGLSGRSEFTRLIWDWSANNEDDLDGYEVEVWSASAGGVKLFPASGQHLVPARKGTPGHFAWDAMVEGLSGSVMRGFTRVRAVDFSGNSSGWTGRALAQSTVFGLPDNTGGIVNTGSVSLTVSGSVTLMSLSIECTGTVVYIWSSFLFRILSAPSPENTFAASYELRRDGQVVDFQTTPSLQHGRTEQTVMEFFDVGVAGTVQNPVTHTYSVTINGFNPAFGISAEASQRRMLVESTGL